MNDLRDLGTASLFTLDPNWASNPKYNIVPLRRLISMRGCADVLQSNGNIPPLTFNAAYLLRRTDKNYLMDFLRSHRGRLNRFWVKHPGISFTLLADTGVAAITIYVGNNLYNWLYQGYERFYIEMPNGDIITRQITGVVEDTLEKRLELTFTPGLDRAILVSHKAKIGRLLLVRFDQDEFEFKHHTQEVAEVSLKFQELIQEYNEL